MKRQGAVRNVVTAALVASISAHASADADLVIVDIGAIVGWGAVNDLHAYSVALTHCNPGNVEIQWAEGSSAHPVTGVNLLRLKEGRLEMIGMSWMSHVMCPLQQNACGSCEPAPTCAALGVHCSTASGAPLYGAQSALGPRSQINPVTGSFPYPVIAPNAAPTVGRRLQVSGVDLDPALNTGAIYLIEAFSISAADAGAGAGNNSSVRRVLVGPKVNGTWTLVPTGPTKQQVTGIELWPANANGWGVPDPWMVSALISIPDDGRLRLAARVTAVTPGTWRYEYAVLNQDSLRSVQRLSVPLPNGISVWNVHAHLPPHHSGEPYDTAPWTSVESPFNIEWRCEDFETNPNANALRFGVLGSWSFDCAAPPAPGAVTMTLHLPGTPTQVSAALLVPSIAGDLNGDGHVDGDDLGALLGAWDGAGFADLNGDGVVDGGDLGALLGNWTR